MAEVQYMDTLAHAKKNLLKGEEMMEESEYSMAMTPYTNMSMARGRGANAKRDSRGRYSSERGGRGRSYGGDRSYEDRSYDMSYAGEEMRELKESIYDIMDELPESVKHDAQKFVKKLEKM